MLLHFWGPQKNHPTKVFQIRKGVSRNTPEAKRIYREKRFCGDPEKKTPLKCFRIFGDPEKKDTPKIVR